MAPDFLPGVRKIPPEIFHATHSMMFARFFWAMTMALLYILRSAQSDCEFLIKILLTLLMCEKVRMPLDLMVENNDSASKEITLKGKR